MSTMNVSLPNSLKDFVDDRVRKDGYSTSSEYVRELIRADQLRQAEQQLVAMLRAGIESGEGIPITKSYWVRKRKALRRGRA
ncbi:MAG: type II toxin-antitoxin system ParD family antitoxin [Betaproteobacteria bacterium]